MQTEFANLKVNSLHGHHPGVQRAQEQEAD